MEDDSSDEASPDERDGSLATEWPTNKRKVELSTEKLKFSRPVDVTGKAGHGGTYEDNVPITLDCGAEADLVSVNFVRRLGLKPCTRSKHCHEVPEIYGVGNSKIPYMRFIYHLRVTLTDRYGREMGFIRPFIAVERDTSETKILLGTSIIRDLRVIIDVEANQFEFK